MTVKCVTDVDVLLWQYRELIWLGSHWSSICVGMHDRPRLMVEWVAQWVWSSWKNRVPAALDVGHLTNTLSEIWRCHAIETMVHNDAQTELDPLWDPQPVKIGWCAHSALLRKQVREQHWGPTATCPFDDHRHRPLLSSSSRPDNESVNKRQ